MPMLEIKMFEIRDRGTLICVIAQRLDLSRRVEGDDAEHWMFRRSGYGDDGSYVFLTKVNGGELIECHYDPYNWGSSTMNQAHLHIEKHWAELKSGDVICTEFLRGERATPKLSERLEEQCLIA